MNKALLSFLLFLSVLTVFGQYGQDNIGITGVGDIRSGEDKAAFKVDYTLNPDIKAKPVKEDGGAVSLFRSIEGATRSIRCLWYVDGELATDLSKFIKYSFQ